MFRLYDDWHDWGMFVVPLTSQSFGKEQNDAKNNDVDRDVIVVARKSARRPHVCRLRRNAKTP